MDVAPSRAKKGVVLQKSHHNVVLIVAFLAAVVVISLQAFSQAPKATKRAKPPTWSKDVRDLFPPDAAKELIGKRPSFNGKSSSNGGNPMNSASGAVAGQPNGAPPAAGSANLPWSKIIESDTLINEVKASQKLVADDVKSLSEFKGGGYKRSRNTYTMLATIFGIIAEYDRDMRWKKEAVGARDQFGRVGINLKVSTDQAFNESKLRSEDVSLLVRGDTISQPPNADLKVKWNDKVANRPPLMDRLKVATDERLNKVMSDAGAFTKGAELAAHEAQIVAALAQTIQREGYSYADDETYLEYARSMQKGALEIAAAAKTKNYDGARAAFGVVRKSCDDCHSSFRQ
jgi:hypothetical protein